MKIKNGNTKKFHFKNLSKHKKNILIYNKLKNENR